MSRVIDGGNVAKRYTTFAAELAEFFDNALKGKPSELPGGYRVRWNYLFDQALGEEYVGRTFASRRLILDSFSQVRPKEPVSSDGKEVVKRVRDLTRKVLDIESYTADLRGDVEFLRDFYNAVFQRGNDDSDTEIQGVSGLYSFGTRDFDDDD